MQCACETWAAGQVPGAVPVCAPPGNHISAQSSCPKGNSTNTSTMAEKPMFFLPHLPKYLYYYWAYNRIKNSQTYVDCNNLTTVPVTSRASVFVQVQKTPNCGAEGWAWQGITCLPSAALLRQAFPRQRMGSLAPGPWCNAANASCVSSGSGNRFINTRQQFPSEHYQVTTVRTPSIFMALWEEDLPILNISIFVKAGSCVRATGHYRDHFLLLGLPGD